MENKAIDAASGNDEYYELEALSLRFARGCLHGQNSSTVCFWLYLVRSSGPGVVVYQEEQEESAPIPLLTIDVNQRLILHGLRLCRETQCLSNEENVIVADKPCGLEKWVHVGFEMGSEVNRLHMDGMLVAERRFSSVPIEKMKLQQELEVRVFGGAGSVQAFVYFVRVLMEPTITNHYLKNPPLELLLEGTSGATDDQEVEEDGSWSVVGGKASCRRNFALDVVLLDALGRSILNKEMEVVAFLVYADSNLPVEKLKDDAEAPLLTTLDGVEFPSTERPIKLIHGRASFKLKISQLSSKCDNRLFRVCFDSPRAPNYPFLRAFSRPIRCVSRNRNNRVATTLCKRPQAGVRQDGTYPPDDVTAGECHDLLACSSGKGSCVKRFRTGPERRAISILCREHGELRNCGVLRTCHGGFALDIDDRPGHPVATPSTQSPLAYFGSSSGRRRHVELPEGGPDCTLKPAKRRTSGHWSSGPFDSPYSRSQSVSDIMVFKYCLEDIQRRSSFLRVFILNHTDEELHELAKRVAQTTGCRHDGYQILQSKNLVVESNEVWSDVTSISHPPQWVNVVSCVMEQFLKVTGARRPLSSKDKVFLKKLAGCCEAVTREQFDRLWSWIYPVCLTLRSSQVRAIWDDEDSKWIEGMIFKEEVEDLLKSSQAMAKPGTFLLRFACSRFWPHPDAGALVVSYIGLDGKINHKLLSIDENSEDLKCIKPLHEQLLSQPELTQLCKGVFSNE